MKLTVTFNRTLQPSGDVVQKQAEVRIEGGADLTDPERLRLLKACGRGLLPLNGVTQVELTREETVITVVDVNTP